MYFSILFLKNVYQSQFQDRSGGGSRITCPHPPEARVTAAGRSIRVNRSPDFPEVLRHCREQGGTMRLTVMCLQIYYLKRLDFQFVSLCEKKEPLLSTENCYEQQQERLTLNKHNCSEPSACHP